MLSNLTEKKNQTLIFIFVSKNTQKNTQELIYFLQENKFNFKRVTKNYKKTAWTENIINSNFVLESHCEINKKKLQILILFLKKYATINSIFFQNQALNEERVFNFDEPFGYFLWKKIQNQKL